MEFTFEGYKNLIWLLQEKGYSLSDYSNYQKYEKTFILRHDVDFDLDKAEEFAEIEKSLGVRSTYFILVTSDFYNIHSQKNESAISNILNMGHDIGLHFDEQRYTEKLSHYSKNSDRIEAIKEYIRMEINILENALLRKITCVSMHRPSKMVLETDLEIPGLVNSYGNKFFREFKYLSDSRMHWRENINELILEGKYKKFHILTHPIWYFEKEKNIRLSLEELLAHKAHNVYDTLNSNFKNLDEIFPEGVKTPDNISIKNINEAVL